MLDSAKCPFVDWYLPIPIHLNPGCRHNQYCVLPSQTRPSLHSRYGLSCRRPSHRRNRLITSVKITLMITMDVRGMNTIPRSVSMRISPGKRPNQLKVQGANCSIAPVTSRTAPATMIHFAMFSVLAPYSTPLTRNGPSQSKEQHKNGQ